jgi:hypothetical protein
MGNVDLRTGEPLDDLIPPRPTAAASWLGLIVLSIGVALAGWAVVAAGRSNEPTKADALQVSR